MENLRKYDQNYTIFILRNINCSHGKLSTLCYFIVTQCVRQPSVYL